MTSKVLVVDDEPVVRSFLVRVLEQGGYSAQAAHNGREALQRLEESPFDLLLTDIKMDQLDGVQLLAQARTQYPDMAVILLTGHATVQSAVEALRLGAHDYLLKPAKNEDILAAVASGLEARVRQRRAAQLEQVAAQVLHVMQDDPGPVTPETSIISCGLLQVDPEAYRVTLGGEPLSLTPTEFRLLTAFARAPGAALDFVRLVQLACGYTCTRQEAREIIGTHVLNLRRKLGIAPKQPLYIESVRGVGYRLIPGEET
jgi:two-component system alkaline phosphatase synthesis response regulator PhoP